MTDPACGGAQGTSTARQAEKARVRRAGRGHVHRQAEGTSTGRQRARPQPGREGKGEAGGQRVCPQAIRG